MKCSRKLEYLTLRLLLHSKQVYDLDEFPTLKKKLKKKIGYFLETK